MSTSPPTSAELKTKRKSHGTVRPRTTRCPSASEIARNLKNFETWSTHQGCEQVSFSDIPEDSKKDVHELFDVTGRLPLSWTNASSKEYRTLSQFATPALLSFIQDAYRLSPSLFSDDNDSLYLSLPELYAEVYVVFSAWRRLQWMRKSKEKWSEADYVANVYNVFRSPAIQESSHRVHCSISLPQPSVRSNMGTQATRILNTKTATPDCAIFIAAAGIRSLSQSAKSPYKILKGHPTVVNSGNTSKGSSFRYQSTPCANLPDNPGFEFASSFWEDKKPVHQLLEDAYRQNRMATASAVRHLHSLHIKVPVFGLVWASGTVRAHVDWCKDMIGELPVILSAPYPGTVKPELEDEDTFHEWQLDRPSDILAVYFLIRNIDRWTNAGFRKLVTQGVNHLLDDVTSKSGDYHPWKRFGDLTGTVLARKENISISTSTQQSSTPPKHKTSKRPYAR